jgi:hypothetical protein
MSKGGIQVWPGLSWSDHLTTIQIWLMCEENRRIERSNRVGVGQQVRVISVVWIPGWDATGSKKVLPSMTFRHGSVLPNLRVPQVSTTTYHSIHPINVQS